MSKSMSRENNIGENNINVIGKEPILDGTYRVPLPSYSWETVDVTNVISKGSVGVADHRRSPATITELRDNLSEAITNLEQQVDSIQVRFGAVVAPKIPNEIKGGIISTSSDPETELGKFLFNIVNRIRDLSNLIYSLEQRCQL